MEFKQDQGHVHTIQETLANRSLNKRVVTFKNAAMTLGHHGAVMIHAAIMVLVHLNNNARDGNSFKYQRVHKRVNRFNTNIKRIWSIVVIQAIGVPVSLNKKICLLIII